MLLIRPKPHRTIRGAGTEGILSAIVLAPYRLARMVFKKVAQHLMFHLVSALLVLIVSFIILTLISWSPLWAIETTLLVVLPVSFSVTVVLIHLYDILEQFSELNKDWKEMKKK